MPTLPLFDNLAASPDAWHHVIAPGGYECWSFDARDTATDTQLVVMFSEGYPFHPVYLRRYFRYRRRPTRVTPPLPQAYPCVGFAVYRNGRLVKRFTTPCTSLQFEAQASGASVWRIGPNTLTRDAEGAWTISLSGTIKAELTFRPNLPLAPHERPFLSGHHWSIANPLCDVSGVIDTGASPSARIQFAGRGYHEHRFGTAPIALDIQRWMRGRVLLDRRTLPFQMVRTVDRSKPDDVCLMEADEEGTREVTVSRLVADWSARAGMRLAYPNGIAFGDRLRLQQPRVIDSTPFSLRLTYEAVLRGEKGTALCELAYPQRLRWPLVGLRGKETSHRS